MTFGCRDFKRDVPFRSRIGNVVSRYVYRFLVGLNLSDTQTGLRGIPRRLMELSLGIRSNRYEFETEQIIAAKTAGFKFREVPIQTVYIDDNSGSHFNPILDSFRIYFVLLRYVLSSVATALSDFIVFYILTANGMALLSANMSARAGGAVAAIPAAEEIRFQEQGGIVDLCRLRGLCVFLRLSVSGDAGSICWTLHRCASAGQGRGGIR